jgi:hypothetical protein
MECVKVKERLSDYIEGFLSAEEKKLFVEHLGSCGKCSEILSDLRKTIKHLHGLEEVEPPPWMTQKVMASVREEAETRKGLWQRLFYPIHIKLPLEAVGVVLVAVTALYFFQSVQPVLKEGRFDDLAEIPMERYSASPGDHAEPLLNEPRSVPSAQEPEAPSSPLRGEQVKTDAEEMVRAKDDVKVGFKDNAKVDAEVKAERGKGISGGTVAPEPSKKGDQREKVKKRSFFGEGIADSLSAPEEPVVSQDMKVAEEEPAFETDKEVVLSYNTPVTEEETESKALSSALRKREIVAGKVESRSITILVDDVEKASSDIGKLITGLDGQIISRESVGIRTVITLRLSQDRMEKFYDTLKELGEVKGDMVVTGAEDRNEIIKIVIEKSPTRRE